MALQITQTLDSGAPVSYFRVAKVMVIRRFCAAEQITISVDGFYSKAARTSGACPMTSKDYVITDNSIIENPGNGCTVSAYAYLKSLPEFAGALDV